MRIERLACIAGFAVAPLAACADATDPVDSPTRNPGSVSLAATGNSVATASVHFAPATLYSSPRAISTFAFEGSAHTRTNR